MSEGVEFLISADDEASAKFAQVARNAESSVKQIKDVGGKAKASTEFIGTIANLTGGSQVGAFAGQLAGLTDKISQFSEVSKAGGAGALAFKAGLVAAVGVIAFNIGKAIGDVVFETARWTNELERAKKKMGELDAQALSLQNKKFGQVREDISLVRDPEDRAKKIDEETKALERQLIQQENTLNNARAATQQAQEAQDYNYIGNKIVENNLESAKREEEAAKAKADATREEMNALKEMNSERTKANELLAKENAAKDRSEAYVTGLKEEVEYLRATKEEQLALDAARNATPEMQDEALALLKERDAIKAKAEAEKELADERKKNVDERIKEAEQAQQEFESEQERIAALIKGEQDRIALRKIALEQGEAASKQKQLEMQGVDSSTAQNLVAQDEALERRQREQENAKKMGEATTNTASESRLLTRGPSQDNGVALLKTNQEMLAEMKEQRKEAAEARREARQKAKQVKLELVS